MIVIDTKPAMRMFIDGDRLFSHLLLCKISPAILVSRPVLFHFPWSTLVESNALTKLVIRIDIDDQ